MKLRGGYDVVLEGRPSATIEVLPEPDALLLPLASRRLSFSELAVEDGRAVAAGDVLATDPANHSVPLLAPRAGTVRLGAPEGCVRLEDLGPPAEPPAGSQAAGSGEAPAAKRDKLLRLGAWQWFCDAHTGAIPSPEEGPGAVMVSTLRLEPFMARGDAQLRQDLAGFIRGLTHLQSLLEYQPIYLVLPDIRSPFALEVREKLRGHAWAKQIDVPLRYPFDNHTVLARHLALRPSETGRVWALETQGVYAIDQALTFSRPCTERIISLGGPAVAAPLHLRAPVGYPIQAVTASRIVRDAPVRVINGGVLTGEAVGEDQYGLDAECVGLTVLPDRTPRELFAWMRPGADRRSYSRCFLSALRGGFAERLSTGLRGERRPCVACGACEEVCPAGIMPHLIHKLLYQDALEEVERVRVDLCVECGLCAYVCPSKIDLRRQMVEAKEAVRRELHPPEPAAEPPQQPQEAQA